MGYEISIKTKIIGFNKPMIKSSWDFHGDDYAHALHVTYVGAVAAASILNPHNTCSLFMMVAQQNSQAKLLEPSSPSLVGCVVNHL